jgi:hypothetical protein
MRHFDIEDCAHRFAGQSPLIPLLPELDSPAFEPLDQFFQ